MKVRLADIENIYLLLEENGIFESVNELTYDYFDEPSLYIYGLIFNSASKGLLKSRYYSKDLEKQGAAGASYISREIALYKCLMEAYERYALLTYNKNHTKYGSFSSQKYALNPSEYIHKSETNSYKYGWISGFDLRTNNEILIPQQLIHLNYYKSTKTSEPLLAPLVSTGAAAGVSHTSTLLRGVYEVIERDAFMCTYLTKGKSIQLDLDTISHVNIRSLIDLCRRYLLNPTIFVIYGDTNIPTILTILIDTTNNQPEISISTKAGLHLYDVILGSIESAIQIRQYTRRILSKPVTLPFKASKNNHITDVISRSLYWSKFNMQKHLDFIIRNSEKVSYQSIHQISLRHEKQELDFVINSISSKYPILYADITPPGISKAVKPLYVYKVLIPGFQPLYLDEIHKKHVITRLKFWDKNINNGKLFTINKRPHPFL